MSTATITEPSDVIAAYRASCAEAPFDGDPALRAAAHNEMVAHAASTCPGWCTIDHERMIGESLPEGNYQHALDIGEIGGVWVAVEQWQRDLTAEQADAIAGLLGKAAAKLREIEARADERGRIAARLAVLTDDDAIIKAVRRV